MSNGARIENRIEIPTSRPSTMPAMPVIRPTRCIQLGAPGSVFLPLLLRMIAAIPAAIAIRPVAQNTTDAMPRMKPTRLVVCFGPAAAGAAAGGGVGVASVIVRLLLKSLGGVAVLMLPAWESAVNGASGVLP